MSKVTVRDMLCDALKKSLREDENVFIIGEEVAEYQGAYKITQGILEEFGSKRVIDTPITEHGFAGLAVGAALAGLRPVVEFMTFNFAMQAIDQIINSAAKTHYMSGGTLACPIVFRGPNGAAARVGAQHSQCYASWYSHIPGLKVVAPYLAEDHAILLDAAIKDPGPVIFLENEILYGRSHEIQNLEALEIGKARVLKEGNDVTLVAFSLQLENALDAAKDLLENGIDVEVIDLRSIRPLDIDTIITSVKKTNRIVALQEGWGFSSVASSICAMVAQHAFDFLDAEPIALSGADVPLPYAENLEKLALPNKQSIIDAVRFVLRNSK